MAIDDIYTMSLLHADGADASTTFTDESGKAWTYHGNAQIDTAQSKFGGASGLFDGTGDWIDTPDHDDFNVGNGNFTIDFWIRRNSTGAYVRICGQKDASDTNTTRSVNIAIPAANTLYVDCYANTTQYKIDGTTAITDTNTWHHVEVGRSGATLYLFLDGTLEGTVNIGAATINNSASTFSIGRQGAYNSQYFNGWVDEFRFTKGVARHTANFTPPTVAYAPPGRPSQAITFF